MIEFFCRWRRSPESCAAIGVKPSGTTFSAPSSRIRIALCSKLALTSALVIKGILPSSGAAAAPPVRKAVPLAATREASPAEDDANLHDVQFVGSRHGWAVGDRGVIWHSADGGETWALQHSGVACPLRSVCFLSDRIGWVAGGGTVPYTRHSYGVILRTVDGGQTWQPLAGPPLQTAPAPAPKPGRDGKTKREPQPAMLPRLRKVQFFSLEEGIVVGDPTGAEPVGVFTTEDGGKSWRPLTGRAGGGWLTAAFADSEMGVVAGAAGKLARVVDGKMVASRLDSLGTQGLYDVTLNGDAAGWLVGDGGLVLETKNAGLVWQVPTTPLPPAVRDAFDFRAVSSWGKNVWIAGNPGSVVWHSPDAGRSWARQKTGQPLPVAAIHFSSNERGCAVGALGTIVRTEDGGRTWSVMRGSGRRLALLALSGSSANVSLPLIAELSGEEGYRSLVAVVAREGEGSERVAAPDRNARLEEAVCLAGGCATHVGWQLPLPTPGLQRDYDKLVTGWDRRTDHRLSEVLIGGLVRQLRTWRPSVLVIEQAERDDALGELTSRVVQSAVQQAADATSFIEQHDLAGLEPWQVQKVFQRLPAGSAGHVHVDPFRYLPHLRSPNHVFAANAEALFLDMPAPEISRPAYRLVTAAGDKSPRGPTGTGMFAGIAVPTDGPARRQIAPLGEIDLEAQRTLANRQRDFAAYTDRNLSDSRHASQLIAQLPQIVRGLSDADGAWQIIRLAEKYAAAGHWELSEAALLELVERYPREPAAVQAMQRLVQLWASGEVTWRRLRQSGTDEQREQNQPEVATRSMIEQVEARLRKQARSLNRTIFDEDDKPREAPPATTPQMAPPTVDHVRVGGVIRKGLEQGFRSWQDRALQMARDLEARDPALAAEPHVQFPLAAIYRQQTSFQKSDQIYRRFIERGAAPGWTQAATAEIWLARPIAPLDGPVAACGFTAERPVLDGALADPCWQDAAEIRLSVSSRDETGRNTNPGRTGQVRQARALFAYDAEFVYFALSVPRAAGGSQDGPVEGERRHDEDLADCDRMLISFDVDRDYVTAFNFAVDQRGRTNDACWNDSSWDPRWFVAAEADDKEWRIEAAIPLEELVPAAPGKGSAWGLGVTRIIPAEAVESWTAPAGPTPPAEAFGILKFDGPGRMR